MVKCLAFIDLLGFSNMVEHDYSKARVILSDFYNISYEIIKGEPEVDGTLFSDSLIAYSYNRNSLITAVCKIYRQCLKQNNEYAKRELNKYFLLPRGGISIGVVNIEDRTELPNLKKEFIVSPALVHSAKIERSIKGSRLLVAVNQDNGEELDIIRNTRSTVLLYDDEGYHLWNKYIYKDILWFADLNKNPEEQAKEINELIKIAITLVKINSKDENVLNQHIGTLRIGLLSQTRFFCATNNSSLLTSLLANFQDEKYWLIWITIFEMVMQSPDSWAAPTRDDLIKFYKHVSLTNGWSKVLEHINKPENSYIKGLFSIFISELKIDTL